MFKLPYLGVSACLAALLMSCSSAGSNVPNVAGVYDCSSNCTGVCDFSATMTITQDEENIIVEADTGNQSGSVDDNGQLDISGDDSNCNGQIVQGTAILDCEFSGTNCQQVTYKRQ